MLVVAVGGPVLPIFKLVGFPKPHNLFRYPTTVGIPLHGLTGVSSIWVATTDKTYSGTSQRVTIPEYLAAFVRIVPQPPPVFHTKTIWNSSGIQNSFRVVFSFLLLQLRYSILLFYFNFLLHFSPYNCSLYSFNNACSNDSHLWNPWGLGSLLKTSIERRNTFHIGWTHCIALRVTTDRLFYWIPESTLVLHQYDS